MHACVIKVKFASRATQKTPKFSKCAPPLSKLGCVHRSYTEGDREGCEVGRQQTEGNFKVADEAICHLTVRCFLDEGAAAIAADGHHAVTLDAKKHHLPTHHNDPRATIIHLKATKQTQEIIFVCMSPSDRFTSNINQVKRPHHVTTGQTC